MERKTIRLISLLISLLMVAVIISGCQGKETESVNNTESADSVTPSTSSDDPYAKYTPVEGKKYVFNIVGQQLGPMLEKDKQTITKYFEDTLGITINFADIDPTKYADIINLKFASGERFDKFFAPNYDTYNKWIKQDLCAEIPEELLENLAPNIYNIYQEENPRALTYTRVNGVSYGLPMYRNYSEFRTPIAWRGDWLKNVGIQKVPETLDEFEQAMYKFANEDPDKNGEKDTYGMSSTAMQMVYGAYGYLRGVWQQKDGNLVYGTIQPEVKEALAKLNQWYKDGIIDPEFITGENKGGYAMISHAFVNGKIGVSCMGYVYHWKKALNEKDTLVSFNADELRKVNQKAYEELTFGQPPKGPTGKCGILQEGLVSAGITCFGKDLENEPDKFGKLLQFYDYVNSSFDNYLISLYGFEGQSYKWENDAVVPINEFEDLKILSGCGGNTMTNIGWSPFKYSEKIFKAQTDFAREFKMNENGIRNELVVGLPSAPKFQAELQKIEDEAILAIIDGTKPLSSFDEFVAKWKAGGGDELTKEANEWFSSLK